MQLVIGGAYSGKRKFLRSTGLEFNLVSAYMGQSMEDALNYPGSQGSLAVEGFEVWIKKQLLSNERNIRQEFIQYYQSLIKLERERGITVFLLMIEMGRGIVPVDSMDRKWRDYAGWVQQDAAKVSEAVYYVWHGLPQRIK
ncbi:bifunctional adenosylcobinamide kinase/adenosylcobinamide-phosphate guanylyltransferase [Peribacillus sp. SCS-37]|uniref:bifunctional adenosylcobinamide kinase/adenosylcobinamide-phosphate guanylyltransferase n=1 Tax=Paraperibacillus esterisolvens TaxID=3115296 RepID=UPI0039059F9E